MAVAAPDKFVQWFRAAAPYIHAFRGRTFVIAFGGEVMSESRFVGLNHDLNQRFPSCQHVRTPEPARPRSRRVSLQAFRACHDEKGRCHFLVMVCDDARLGAYAVRRAAPFIH